MSISQCKQEIHSFKHIPTIGGNVNLCRMFSLLCSGTDMDCHSNTYDDLLERCGCTESNNTNCVQVEYILMELWHYMYEVYQTGEKIKKTTNPNEIFSP